MPKIQYIEHKFYAKSLERLGWIENIIEEYVRRDRRVTVRQVFYQIVVRRLMSNSTATYDAIQYLLDKGRMSGRIDWEAIEDRSRVIERPTTWDSPAEQAAACAEQYLRDVWATQNCVVEIVIEKAALVGEIENVCAKYRVPYVAAIGFLSHSTSWEMGFKVYKDDPRRVVVLGLFDHDPSGVVMGRELPARLEMFAERKIDFRRIALTTDQTRDLPPNIIEPEKKAKDSRVKKYEAEFGPDQWELDALGVGVIENLIEREIRGLINWRRWNAARAQEKIELERVRKNATREARHERRS